jgi:hypothetical protein
MYHSLKCFCGKPAVLMYAPSGPGNHLCKKHSKDYLGDPEYELLDPSMIGKQFDSKYSRMIYSTIFGATDYSSPKYLNNLSYYLYAYDPESRYYYTHSEFPEMIKDFWKWWCKKH